MSRFLYIGKCHSRYGSIPGILRMSCVCTGNALQAGGYSECTLFTGRQ